MMTRTLILALSLTAAAPAMATGTENASVEVRLGDLNLEHAADRQRLDTRLRSAARSICRAGLRGTAENSRRAACVSAALANAGPQAERAIAQAQRGTQLALLMVGAAR